METQTNIIEESKPLSLIKEKGLRMTSIEFEAVFRKCDMTEEQVETLCALAIVSLRHAEKHVDKDYKPLFTGEEAFERLNKKF